MYERPVGRTGQIMSESHSDIIEVETMTPARILLAQMIIDVVKKSFERVETAGGDSFLQFNSLILLDNLF